MERQLLLSSLCLKQESTEIIIWTGETEDQFKYNDQSECDTEDQLNLQEMHFGMVGRPLTEISKCDHIICMPSYSLQGNGCWSNGSAANLSLMRFNLDLVDLPNSEWQRRLGYVGKHFQVNAKNYNSSTVFSFKTSTLAAVAVAPWKPKYIPHRDSKISFCLKELLGRNSKSQIIWDVKRSICSSSKALDSLKFAQQAKLIENKAMLGEKDQEKVDDSCGIIEMPTEQAMTIQSRQLDQLVHQTERKMESIPAFSLMKYAEEILGLQLELHVWNIIREERKRPVVEATHELKEAKSVIEALKLQQIQASAEMEDLKERNSHYCSLLSEKDVQICGLKDQVEELTVGFSRDLQMAKEELNSMNKQLCAATRELKRVKSVNEAFKSQNSIATYKMEDLQKSNRNYLNLLVEKDAEISALKKQHCRKEIIDLCEEHEEEEEQLPYNNSELLAKNQELIAALHQKEEDLKQRNGLIETLHMTILEKDARIDTIVRALKDIQNMFKGSGTAVLT
ncbi:hypothetical protein Tsubulata_029296 [Turnera subulata]|uniref:Kinesin motor domain-containing protein n=1 Tax=Turnera subulata TaxID=218843 RepID=A0A9Q0FVH2_9ROSI|nr:hypothetical protein Tsubulata_029296 [Turnera subulata]